MGMGAGRAAVAAAAAVLLTLLAGGAYADCYDDCFSDCMARQDQGDYCSYACDKVCFPDAHATRRQRNTRAVVGPSASLADHHHPSLDKKQDDADAVRPAALPDDRDHPFHERHGAVGVVPAGEPDPGHVIGPVLP